jgi:diphthamide synthase (EF-2-diphthine--ammonia ligase)
MSRALTELGHEGVTQIVFGDLFLEDVRAYRERQLKDTGFSPLFPLWGRPTRGLAEEMIEAGVKATVVCVDPRRLGAEWAGRTLDRRFLDELPPGVDPCGERGEFHSCVTAGPMFDRPLGVRPGPVVERDGFVFADLELASDPF